ncbi:MAG TPA: hypothetical protein GX693_04505 [Firmicutes bacterium]|nr:hypothetical protein [Bacillota bacterium]
MAVIAGINLFAPPGDGATRKFFFHALVIRAYNLDSRFCGRSLEEGPGSRFPQALAAKTGNPLY